MEILSVLVLDDDSASLLAISLRLQELNFKVFAFQSGSEALDFLKNRAAKEEGLDLILAEVHVSTMASRTLANSELLNHIMNELHVPFVSMCAKDDQAAISECMAIGACFHLPKPLTTGSFNMLRHTARQHKCRTRKELRHRVVEKHGDPEFSKARGHSTKPDQLILMAHGDSKKPDQFRWTVELHAKFLEAIAVLGDEYAVPLRILKYMNVKNLTVKHISSHLQKHRLHQLKANHAKFQQNANNKPAVHNASTTESTTPVVAADIREMHLSSLSTNIMKKSARAAPIEAYSYADPSGIFRHDTESVWDRYQKKLESGFYWSSRRRQREQSAKRKGVARDGGVSSEGPKTSDEMGYGAPFESSGSNSLSTSSIGQTRKNNLTETSGNNDNVWDTAAMDPSDALLDREESSFWMSQMKGLQEQLNFTPEDLLHVEEAWNEALLCATQPSLVKGVEPMTQEATVGDAPVPEPVMQFAQTQVAAVGDAPVPDPVMQFGQTQVAAVGDAPVLDHVTQFSQDDEYRSLSPLW